MKLNADIIFDGLRQSLSAELLGPRSTELRLRSPEFYIGGEDEFLPDHLYIVHTNRLPRRAALTKNTTLICVGEGIPLAYYQEHCCVIRILENTDIFAVFNLVQEIFARYEEWFEHLREILERSASVEEMITCSQEIFGNPIFVIDSNFHFLAQVGYDQISPPWNLYDETNLGLSTITRFLELHEPALHTKGPQLLHLLDTTTLNVNLHDHENYMGCLTIDYRRRPYGQGDSALADVLAQMLIQALLKFSSFVTTKHSLLRKILQDTVDGTPIDYDQRQTLERSTTGRKYICAKLRLTSRFAKLPMGYICNEVESAFPGSVAFERKGDVLCFLEADALPDKDALRQAMKPFTDAMDLDVGISDAFSDIFSARLYYHQASAALENGNLTAPGEKLYCFQDYALTEMVINALGKMPVELFFSDGMRRLAAHDTDAPVSYLDTLRVYLNENMSMTRTAAALFVHRSTLLERISRIERDLNMDLHDPDTRLRIQILLKAIQLHDAHAKHGEQA